MDYKMNYAIVNSDNTIHSFAEKNVQFVDEAAGQALKEITEILTDVDPEFYTWDSINDVLVKKSVSQIDTIKVTRSKVYKRMMKIEAQEKLSQILVLETSDPNEDYSAEKTKYQKIIDDNKVI